MGNSRWQQTRNAATERLAFGEFGCKTPRTRYRMDEQPMVADGIYRLDALRQCGPFRFGLSRRHHQPPYALFPPLHTPDKKFYWCPLAPISRKSDPVQFSHEACRRSCYELSVSSRHRRTLITSSRSPSKTICFTGFLPLLLARFSQSRTSIQRTSPSEFLITSSTGNACAIQ